MTQPPKEQSEDQKIVEVRDQVLTMVLLPDSFICSIRVMRRSSTNGPFLDERDT